MWDKYIVGKQKMDYQGCNNSLIHPEVNVLVPGAAFF